MKEPFQELMEEMSVTVQSAGPRLEVRNGPEDGRLYPITAETVRIGRQAPNPDSLVRPNAVGMVVIRTDKAISREHCELTALSSTTFLLKDLDSRFGTELNGTRINGPVPVKHGDTITIGDTMLMLRTES